MEHAPLIDELNLSLRPASIVLPVGAEAQKPYEEQDESCESVQRVSHPVTSRIACPQIISASKHAFQASAARQLAPFTQIPHLDSFEDSRPSHSLCTRYLRDDTARKRATSLRRPLLSKMPQLILIAPSCSTPAATSTLSLTSSALSTPCHIPSSMCCTGEERHKRLCATPHPPSNRHATDSQSWPLFIPAFPHLNKVASYSSEAMYSRADILYLQEYAAALGISILLEVSERA